MTKNGGLGLLRWYPEGVSKTVVFWKMTVCVLNISYWESLCTYIMMKLTQIGYQRYSLAMQRRKPTRARKYWKIWEKEGKERSCKRNGGSTISTVASWGDCGNWDHRNGNRCGNTDRLTCASLCDMQRQLDDCQHIIDNLTMTKSDTI